MSKSLQLVCPHCNKLNRVPESKLEDSAHCGNCHKQLFTGKPLAASNDQMKRHISKNDIPVVVDFWAPWCGPCKIMAPVFQQSAAELEPRVRFLKVNTEDYPNATAPYGIRGIPTLILFKHNKELDRLSGAVDKNTLTSWLQRHR